jgi:hypothetical protein
MCRFDNGIQKGKINLMRNCIINFADGVHRVGQNRLVVSLTRVKYVGDKIFYIDTPPDNCPTQNISPWSFKPFLFEEARKRGYKKILWVDASVYFIRNPKKIFDYIKKKGYFIFSNKVSTVGEWSSDYTLQKLGLSRKEACGIPEIRAHIIGLDLDNPLADQFLKKWLEIAKDGISFRGLPLKYPLEKTFQNTGEISIDKKVLGHRHDQTVASILAWRLGMKTTNKFCTDYIGEIMTTNNPIPINTIILQDRSYKESTNILMTDKYDGYMYINRYIYILYSFLFNLVRNMIKNI